LPSRLRRTVGARLDELAARRLGALPDPPPAEAPPAEKPPAAPAEVLAAFEDLWSSDFEQRPPAPEVQDMIVRQFHRLYYHSLHRTWKDTFYRGVTIWKCPLDLWLYQELLHELRPQLIVETGTAFGGSAYFLGDLCDTLGLDALITTIDIEEQPDRPAHRRVTYVTARPIRRSSRTSTRRCPRARRRW
jgi:hypothetical protein